MASDRADQWSLEEYKWAKSRVETHERHYHQSFVFAATGFTAVLALSEKLPVEWIPLIGITIVFAGAHAAYVHREHQRFATAYIIERFSDLALTSYDAVYHKVYAEHPIKKSLWHARISWILGLATSPFVLLTILSSMVALHHVGSALPNLIARFGDLGALVYMATVAAMHILVLRVVVRGKWYDIDHFRKVIGRVTVADALPRVGEPLPNSAMEADAQRRAAHGGR